MPSPPLSPLPSAAGAARRAVVDVGTNSVKLLVGDVSGDTVEPVLETSEQTRLGVGLYERHHLQVDAIARTAAVVARFAERAFQAGAVRLRVIATSAARDAANRSALESAVHQVAGRPLEVLSGEQEAEWAFRGVATDPALAHRPLVIVDAGGGSTEFVIGTAGSVKLRRSYPLGTVRWLERRRLADPPSPEDWARGHEDLRRIFEASIEPALGPELERLPRPEWVAVGTSGTATILARMERRLNTYDRAALEGVELSRERVREWRERLWALPLAERLRVPGLPPERADVILPGLAIYEAALERLGLARLHVTLRGLRFAALQEPGPA